MLDDDILVFHNYCLTYLLGHIHNGATIDIDLVIMQPCELVAIFAKQVIDRGLG